MAARGVVLLTGATGFVGTQVARRLRADTTCTVIALVRADDQVAAARRLERAWWDWPDLVAAIGRRVEPLAGDVCRPGLGLADATLRALTRRVTHVIHAAAELRLEAPLEELRRTNVAGTRHVLDLARAAQADHGVERFAYVSTAYVCGSRPGRIEEASLTDQYGFSTAYEQTKFEAEALVRAAQAELGVSIFRPGMIVGDSKTGAIQTFNTIYPPLRLLLNGKLPMVPTRRSLRLNMVPVDYVAEGIVRLTFDPRAEGLTFHLIPPPAQLPTAGALVDGVRGWAAKQLGLRLRPTLFLDIPTPDVPGIPEALRVLRPYLHGRQEFLRDNVDRLLGPTAPDWRVYLPKMLDYAVARGFLQRSERTVSEQVIYRLSNTRWPVTYHDISAEGVITRATSEVRGEMLTAAAALQALGIHPGDRVAIVGLNSSRYLTLDVAIGLIGAVSVPLYPTSPPVEIDALVKASGARLLLIGTPRLLARAGELRSDLPLVSFGHGPLPAGLVGRALDWPGLLRLGGQAPEPQLGKVGLGELATLRYTSGSTGPPKAATFHHASLRWMAETLASLVPWQARNRPATYLSFLPMNHVVEGMLATYAAYFLPTAVDIYFLEDFRALPAALCSARPTVFFSVPRVYEKVWDAVQASLPGRWYLAARPGPWKSCLRALVRQAVLRRAGFDRCAQLIVGSAPVNETLLQAFHELGIQIYSAYGLTEARWSRSTGSVPTGWAPSASHCRRRSWRLPPTTRSWCRARRSCPATTARWTSRSGTAGC
ncbi:MAG TPA: SDR family oxidoreductase [Chloroflexota bacterium]|nr:SDR family oxidoreductase [Chloroflexota bacterium]